MPIAIASLALVTLSAQTPPPTFDVASVKSSDGTSGDGWAFNGRGGRFTATNVPLLDIIALAYRIPYQVQRFRIVGADSGLLSRRFHVDAKMTDGLSSEQISLRVKSLLVERFGLRAHSEVRQGPIYALVVAHPGTLGPELRPSQHNCNQYRTAWRENHTPASEVVPPRDAKNRPLCGIRVGDDPPLLDRRQIREAGTIGELIDQIQFLERPVVDATQLTGDFEWQLTFSSAAMPRPGSDVPPMPVALREQLGLELEKRTGPIETLVIDSVQMPTPN